MKEAESECALALTKQSKEIGVGTDLQIGSNISVILSTGTGHQSRQAGMGAYESTCIEEYLECEDLVSEVTRNTCPDSSDEATQ